MNKFIIRCVLILLITLVTSCSYKPIFSEKEYNFEINKLQFEGEEHINKIIERKLNLIKKNSGQKIKYDLLINTQRQKTIFSKDSKGDPIKFELEISTFVEVSNDKNLLLDNKIVKNNIYNNDTDKFKLEQNEEIILENLSEKISDIIISSIINLDDN